MKIQNNILYLLLAKKSALLRGCPLAGARTPRCAHVGKKANTTIPAKARSAFTLQKNATRSHVDYAVLFETDKGTLTWFANRNMLRELGSRLVKC